eukprot:PhM_4_TR3022/c2_g2_i3/m.46583
MLMLSESKRQHTADGAENAGCVRRRTRPARILTHEHLRVVPLLLLLELAHRSILLHLLVLDLLALTVQKLLALHRRLLLELADEAPAHLLLALVQGKNLSMLFPHNVILCMAVQQIVALQTGLNALTLHHVLLLEVLKLGTLLIVELVDTAGAMCLMLVLELVALVLLVALEARLLLLVVEGLVLLDAVDLFRLALRQMDLLLVVAVGHARQLLRVLVLERRALRTQLLLHLVAAVVVLVDRLVQRRWVGVELRDVAGLERLAAVDVLRVVEGGLAPVRTLRAIQELLRGVRRRRGGVVVFVELCWGSELLLRVLMVVASHFYCFPFLGVCVWCQ